ncbi:MAG TPA: cytochrome c biogenesis protein CcdA, partial [Streptosporangiaceae bacterium]|nr:cytochrome c biogenesis protein CcdA [Streptosporangiaceae bacterium]
LAGRGALLAFVYGLGIGIPFLFVSLAFQRGMRAFSFARRRAALVTRIGGAMLVLVGVLQVTRGMDGGDGVASYPLDQRIRATSVAVTTARSEDQDLYAERAVVSVPATVRSPALA